MPLLGQKILEIPHNLIDLPVTVDVISTLSVWLTDQHGELLDLRGEELIIGGIRDDHVLLLTPAEGTSGRETCTNSFER